MFKRILSVKIPGARLFSTTRPIQMKHQDIIDNYVHLSAGERIKTIFSSAIGAFRDPWRGDLVSALGDLTAYNALLNIKDKMLKDPVGRQILEDQPRVNHDTVDWEYLKNLDANKFGRKYYEFMQGHGFDPEERPLVKYVPDYELAYILQRYKEIHDYIHVLLNYDINVHNELAVKWFEMIQLELPSTALSAFFGPFILGASERNELVANHLNQVIQNGKRCPLVLNIYWEKEFETDITELRDRLGIQPLK